MEATTSICSLFVWRGVFKQEPISEQQRRSAAASAATNNKSSSAASSWESLLLTNNAPTNSNGNNSIEEESSKTGGPAAVRLQRVRDRTTSPNGDTIRDRNLTVLMSPQDHVHVYIGKRAIVFSNNHGVCLSSLEILNIFGTSLEETRDPSMGSGDDEPKIPFELEVDRALFDPVVQSSTALSHSRAAAATNHHYGPSQLNLIALSNAPSSATVPQGQQEFEIYTLEGESITMHRLHHALSYQWSLVNAEASVQKTIRDCNTKSLTTMTLKTLQPDKMFMTEAAQARYGVSRTLVAAPSSSKYAPPSAYYTHHQLADPSSRGGISNVDEYDGVPSLPAPSPERHALFLKQQQQPLPPVEEDSSSPHSSRSHPKFVITRARSPSPPQRKSSHQLIHHAPQQKLSPDRLAGQGGSTEYRSGQRSNRGQGGYPLPQSAGPGAGSPPRRSAYTRDLGPLKPEGTESYDPTPMPSHPDYYNDQYHQSSQLPPTFDELHYRHDYHHQRHHRPYSRIGGGSESLTGSVAHHGNHQNESAAAAGGVNSSNNFRELRTEPMEEDEEEGNNQVWRATNDLPRRNLTFTPAQQKLILDEEKEEKSKTDGTMGVGLSHHQKPPPTHHQARVYQSSLRRNTTSSSSSAPTSTNYLNDKSRVGNDPNQSNTPSSSSSQMVKKSVTFTVGDESQKQNSFTTVAPAAQSTIGGAPDQNFRRFQPIPDEEEEPLTIQSGAQSGKSGAVLRERYKHLRTYTPPITTVQPQEPPLSHLGASRSDDEFYGGD